MSLTRIVLVGAPGTDKFDLGADLADHLRYNLYFQNQYDELEGSPLGALVDYRVELLLSLLRAKDMAKEDNSIHVGSVLDNLAHTCVYSADAIGVDEVTAHRMMLTGGLTYAIVQDSFKADLIFFLPYQGEKTEDGFIEQLDNIYPEIFDEFQLQYVTLSGTLDEKFKQALKEIEEHIANIGSEKSGTTNNLPELSSEVDSG